MTVILTKTRARGAATNPTSPSSAVASGALTTCVASRALAVPARRVPPTTASSPQRQRPGADRDGTGHDQRARGHPDVPGDGPVDDDRPGDRLDAVDGLVGRDDDRPVGVLHGAAMAVPGRLARTSDATTRIATVWEHGASGRAMAGHTASHPESME